jgi:hypothetical protein
MHEFLTVINIKQNNILIFIDSPKITMLLLYPTFLIGDLNDPRLF